MIPTNITQDHMLQVIQAIDNGNSVVPPPQQSDHYCLVYEGRRYHHYPPKVVIRQANVLANGQELWSDKGGEAETNPFCRCRGFSVIKHGGAPH